jgi:tRNA-splicing ligase RtcB
MFMRYIDGIAVFGDPDENTIKQMQRVAATGPVVAAALMADNHYGYSQPIGGVVAYENAVSPSGVGYDISCGIRATRTNMKLSDIPYRQRGTTLDVIADRIAAEVSFGVGRAAAVKTDHSLFSDVLWQEKELAPLKQLAQSQLGTVGAGNHFVDLLVDDGDFIWVMTHFGSRGFGHKVASGFLNLAAGRAFDAKAPGESMDQPPTILRMESSLGQYYWDAMTLAGEYAYAGRDAVVEQVLGILGAEAAYTVHNHHNYAWEETWQGSKVIVVRKGATPATQARWVRSAARWAMTA